MTSAIFLLAIPVLLGLTKKKPKKSSISTLIIKIPQGKGLFLDTLTGLDFPSFHQTLKNLNIQWICVLLYEKEKEQLDLKARGILKALSDAKIKIWLWSIPSAYDIDNFIKYTKEYQEKSWIEGFIIYLEEEFIKVQNANQVLFSKLNKEIRKPIGLLSDPEIELENLSPIFKFDAYQVHSGLSGEDNTNIEKKFPVFMDKTGKLNASLPTYAFWWDPLNLDWIKNS